MTPPPGRRRDDAIRLLDRLIAILRAEHAEFWLGFWAAARAAVVDPSVDEAAAMQALAEYDDLAYGPHRDNFAEFAVRRADVDERRAAGAELDRLRAALRALAADARRG